MKIVKKPFKEIPQFSKKDIAYQCEDPLYQPFFKYSADLNGFQSAIEDRKAFAIDRSLLVSEIEKAYTTLPLTESQQQNLDALSRENGYTVITAHQPSLFTGPLYYVLKIFSAINLAERLNQEFRDIHVVPVFVSGGEDHDFEEVNHTHLFGKTITWNNEEGGSVGRMSLKNFASAIDSVSEILGNGATAQSIKQIISDTLAASRSYGQFTFQLVNSLFGAYGILVVSMDNSAMKRRFIPILQKEIIERPSKKIIEQTQNELDKAGFKSQAFPRELNLFYLGDGFRERLEFSEGSYQVLNQNLSFTESEILEELNTHPERFSPNVVMRPIYQEYIFPNLAYIGGGGEIAYWLERKNQFAHFGVFFPLLMRRNSAMIVTPGQQKIIAKLDLTLDHLFADSDSIINQFLDNRSDVELHLDDEKKRLENIFQEIADRAEKVDPGLKKSTLAEAAKQLKVIDQIASRLKRSLKKQEEVNVNRIRKIKESLFPGNGLQERHDNFLQFYSMYGNDLLKAFKDNLDPLDKQFTIFYL